MRQTYHGLRKCCEHPRKQWSECGCCWYFDFACRGTRHREGLGTFDAGADAEEAFEEVKARIRNGEAPSSVETPLDDSKMRKVFAAA